MPPSTMFSTSNVILFPGRPFGPSDRKPRRIGAARLLRHDRQLGVHQLPPGRAKLTKPPQQLDQIAPTPAEAEDVSREGILAQHTLSLHRQAVEALAHVRHARRQPYPGAGGQTDHRSSSITRRSVAGATSPRIHTRAPLPNSISIKPARSTRRRRRARSGTISTGTIVPPPSVTAGGSFGSVSRRHLNSWLAFTSCRRATIDTDDPASSVSATI